MIGFSFHLNKIIDSDVTQYFEDMKNCGFSEVFTSAHSDAESSHSLITSLNKLMTLIEKLKLHLTIDINSQTLKLFQQQADLKNRLQLITFRLDDTFSNLEKVKLSESYSIALNASTIGNSDIAELSRLKLKFDDTDVWYNSYPHVDTGLDLTWFAQKNRWLKKLGFKIHAFVAGSEPLSGPLFDGMPTLERHRKIRPFISAIELQKLDVDDVVIGDDYLNIDQRKSFCDYFVKGYIPLHISDTRIGTPEYLFTKVFHNCKDPARDLIRLSESERMNTRTIEPTNNTKRIFGSVTIDNRLFESFMGEIQIVCTHLPASQRVNVLGKIIADDLKLLSYIDGGSAFKLIKV